VAAFAANVRRFLADELLESRLDPARVY